MLVLTRSELVASVVLCSPYFVASRNVLAKITLYEGLEQLRLLSFSDFITYNRASWRRSLTALFKELLQTYNGKNRFPNIFYTYFLY